MNSLLTNPEISQQMDSFGGLITSVYENTDILEEFGVALGMDTSKKIVISGLEQLKERLDCIISDGNISNDDYIYIQNYKTISGDTFKTMKLFQFNEMNSHTYELTSTILINDLISYIELVNDTNTTNLINCLISMVYSYVVFDKIQAKNYMKKIENCDNQSSEKYYYYEYYYYNLLFGNLSKTVPKHIDDEIMSLNDNMYGVFNLKAKYLWFKLSNLSITLSDKEKLKKEKSELMNNIYDFLNKGIEKNDITALANKVYIMLHDDNCNIYDNYNMIAEMYVEYIEHIDSMSIKMNNNKSISPDKYKDVRLIKTSKTIGAVFHSFNEFLKNNALIMNEKVNKIESKIKDMDTNLEALMIQEFESES